MIKENSIKKIVITGPESTGKTTMAEFLSKEFNTIFIPEYARKYIQARNNKYDYNDVLNITKHQIKELTKKYNNANKFVFFDTGLIITKIWFIEVFNKVPELLENALRSIKIDCLLLCYPDIEWIPDDVRVNKGEKRNDLFLKYRQELENYNFKYKIIKGEGKKRFLSAKKFISSAYCL